MFLLKLALRPWKISPFSQLTSILSVSFLIYLGTLMSWLIVGMKPLVEQIKSEQMAVLYFNPNLQDQDRAKLTDEITVLVGAHAETYFVSAENFLTELKKTEPALVRQILDLGDTLFKTTNESSDASTSMVPSYLSVSGRLNEDVVSQIKKKQGVLKVDLSSHRYQSVLGAFEAIETILKALLIGLLVALLSAAFHLAKHHQGFVSEARSLLQLMGAGEVKLLVPHFLSGAFIGIGASVLTGVFWFISAPMIHEYLQILFPLLKGIDVPRLQGTLIVCLGGVLFALFSGLLGAFYSRSSKLV